MPKIVFHKLTPVTLDVPDCCPKCGANFQAAMLDKDGKPLSDAERFGTSGHTRPDGARAPLDGYTWDASVFAGRLTGASGPGDSDEVVQTNSLELFSIDKNRLMRLECARCHGWHLDPEEDGMASDADMEAARRQAFNAPTGKDIVCQVRERVDGKTSTITYWGPFDFEDAKTFQSATADEDTEVISIQLSGTER